jgi:hypothetical protein
MTTGQRECAQAAASHGAVFDLRSEGRRAEGARLRLGLAVAGLVALVAWGALSHVGTEPTVEAQGATSAQEAPRYDGRGKWTGYTSDWRSRPQIFRDAGVTADR